MVLLPLYLIKWQGKWWELKSHKVLSTNNFVAEVTFAPWPGAKENCYEEENCRQQSNQVSGHLLMQGPCPCANVTLNCTSAPPPDPKPTHLYHPVALSILGAP